MTATSRVPTTLASQPFFSEMAHGALAALDPHVYRREYPAGELLFSEGEGADRFFIVRTGLVRLDLELAGREPVGIELVGCDAALGWSWLLPPFVWHMSARALEHTKAFVFDAVVLRDLMSTDPIVGYELMRRYVAVVFDRTTTRYTAAG